MSRVAHRSAHARSRPRGTLRARPRGAPHARVVQARVATALCALLATLAAGGCATSHPPALDAHALAEAESFPYFPVYWVGPRFGSIPLSAVDGKKGYISSIGDSVYYGDCVPGKSALSGGGSCLLPLQVTTVVYRLHSNASLGSQRNALVRGVPATIYDGGRSIEIYSGRLAIDVFSDSLAQALAAAQLLRPLNVAASAGVVSPDASAGAAGPTAPAGPQPASSQPAGPETAGSLPAPVYCPGLSGPQPAAVQAALARLAGDPCRQVRAAQALLSSP